MTSIRHCQDYLTERLTLVSETASLDAQVLLAELTGRTRSWVLAHPEAELLPEQIGAMEAALARLSGGEPLPYVLGHWEFFGLDLLVTPATLIPRPETEMLVEDALEWMSNSTGNRLGVDVGTGAGCIAIALAQNQPGLQVVACDASLAALRIARENIERHEVGDRVHCLQSDLLPAIVRPFNLICANLPYIPTSTLPGLRVSAWEPRLALDGGRHGIEIIARLLTQALDAIAPGGLILLEIGAGQGDIILSMARRIYTEAEISIKSDFAGNDRLLRILLP